MNLIKLIKEELNKIKEDRLASKNDYKNFIYSMENTKLSNNIFILNDTTYLTNVYEVTSGIANIVALYSNITNIPKDSLLLKKNQKINLYDGYSLFDTNLITDIKRVRPEFNPVQGKYFVLEILNDKNYTKIDSSYIIDLNKFIELYDILIKYNQKIDSNLLKNIKNNLNKYNKKNIDDLISNDNIDVLNRDIIKYNPNDEENYEKLNTKYKYDRKNIGKVILTKFDKYWGKFAPKKFIIYDNSFYKPIDINLINNASKNKLNGRELKFYGIENKNTPFFYKFFDENNKPKYKEDNIYAAFINGNLIKDDKIVNQKNESYTMTFIFDLIIEKNTTEGNKYYSVTYIDGSYYDNPYKIKSYKDFIETNKNIISLINEITEKILNNKL